MARLCTHVIVREQVEIVNVNELTILVLGWGLAVDMMPFVFRLKVRVT